MRYKAGSSIIFANATEEKSKQIIIRHRSRTFLIFTACGLLKYIQWLKVVS